MEAKFWIIEVQIYKKDGMEIALCPGTYTMADAQREAYILTMNAKELRRRTWEIRKRLFRAIPAPWIR